MCWTLPEKDANGTNLDIYTYNGGDNQKFLLTKMPTAAIRFAPVFLMEILW